MSTSVSPSLNGRVKKSLEFQLNRLDTILDGLADALNGAVADAVKKAVEPAAREAVRIALEEAMAQLPKQSQPSSTSPLARFWGQVKDKVASVVKSVKCHLSTAYHQVKQYSTRAASAVALAMQTGMATIRSKTLRIGMVIGAASSCAISLFRKDAKRVWWCTGIVICALIAESYLGTLGTLLMGGGVFYLTLRHEVLSTGQTANDLQAA